MSLCFGHNDRTNAPLRHGGRRAVSTVELLVTMGILSFLVAVSVPVLTAARRGGAQALCATNLHGITIAFSTYAADNVNAYPTPSASIQWEDLLRPYVPRKSFRCPADGELFATLGSSYDWRDTGDPVTTLAGKLTLQTYHSDTSLAYDMLPGWHVKNKIHVGRLDSSVELMDQAAFFAELQKAPERP